MGIRFSDEFLVHLHHRLGWRKRQLLLTRIHSGLTSPGTLRRYAAIYDEIVKDSEREMVERAEDLVKGYEAIVEAPRKEKITALEKERDDILALDELPSEQKLRLAEILAELQRLNAASQHIPSADIWERDQNRGLTYATNKRTECRETAQQLRDLADKRSR